MEKNYDQVQQSPAGPCRAPAGVFNPSVEGFASAGDGKSTDEKGEPSQSGPASTTDTFKNQVKAADAVVENLTTETKKETKKATEVKPNTASIKKKEEFQSATGGLFKLGEMPSENKDGPHLDAGQTLVAAMKSLDPSTVSEMTDGTKQLLETQKNLMGMLKTMTPVLAEGRELLNTFSGMFGGGPNNGPGLKF
jgi:hypothetical protein